MDADGYVYLLDRKNDLIITGGMNVYSTEVENALQGCDGVRQLAIVGVPDDDWGEKVVAFVVPADPHTFDPAALRRHVADTLARYKHPKDVRLVSELPLTMYGKVDKKRLRALWQE
jgi:fatty-acyl-CoA synthase/long-chain acyl-CoA synthetase